MHQHEDKDGEEENEGWTVVVVAAVMVEPSGHAVDCSPVAVARAALLIVELDHDPHQATRKKKKDKMRHRPITQQAGDGLDAALPAAAEEHHHQHHSRRSQHCCCCCGGGVVLQEQQQEEEESKSM